MSGSVFKCILPSSFRLNSFQISLKIYCQSTKPVNFTFDLYIPNMMWEYIVILSLSIVDMVTSQSSSIPILTKSSLQSAVNSWCQTSGSTDQRNIQFTTSGGCSSSNICFGPIAGKPFPPIFWRNLFDQHLSIPPMINNPVSHPTLNV